MASNMQSAWHSEQPMQTVGLIEGFSCLPEDSIAGHPQPRQARQLRQALGSIRRCGARRRLRCSGQGAREIISEGPSAASSSARIVCTAA